MAIFCHAKTHIRIWILVSYKVKLKGTSTITWVSKRIEGFDHRFLSLLAYGLGMVVWLWSW